MAKFKFFLLVVLLGLGACAELSWPSLESLRTGVETPALESDYERGKRELTAGRLGLAVRHFLAALERAPKSVEALNGLGAAFDRLGRFDLSARAYGRALAIDPVAVQTLNNMGYSFYLQGRYALALSYLRNAASRAGAGALTRANHRLAVLALARAGGPAPRSPDQGPVSLEGERRPYLRVAGKAIRDLVTKQSEAAGSDPRLSGPSFDRLPAFMAAPMALQGSWAASPALGAVGSSP